MTSADTARCDRPLRRSRRAGLFKLRIGVLITVTALVGFVVTPGRGASAWQVLVLALADAGLVGQRRRLQPVLRTRHRPR